MFLVGNFIQETFLRNFKILITHFNLSNFELGKVVNLW